jgi:hypothetical protein
MSYIVGPPLAGGLGGVSWGGVGGGGDLAVVVACVAVVTWVAVVVTWGGGGPRCGPVRVGYEGLR